MSSKTGHEIKTGKNLSFQKMQQAIILMLLVVLCIFSSIMSPTFLTWKNIVETIFANAAALGVVAIGMTFVMIGGGFDLSVGSIIAICTVVLILAMNYFAPWGTAAAIIAALVTAALAGAALGAINGGLIAYIGVNPFVVTLSTMLVFRGIALIMTGGGQALQVASLPLRKQFSSFYDDKVPFFTHSLPIPFPIIIFIAVLAVGYYLLKYTRFGHYIFALGGNEGAAWLAGVNTRLVKASTYALVGLTCAIAAVIYVAITATALAESHQGRELDAIASVIVGGTPLGGGSGGLIQTFIGLLLLQVISNLLTQFGVGAEYRPVVTGLIILIVVMVDVLARKRARA